VVAWRRNSRGIVAFLGDEVFESVSGVEWVSVEPRSWHRPGLYDGHMSQQGTIEVTVGEDGAVVLSADQLDRLGAHPGDRVRVEPVAPRRIRSMLGSGVGAPGPSRGFSSEDLRAVRREMGDRIGDDLTPEVRFLADTQVLVWYVTDPDRLTALAVAAMQASSDDEEPVGVSAFSLVELAYAAEKKSNAISREKPRRASMSRP